MLKLDEKQTTARLEDAIAERLKRYPRPLFIDQANFLSEKALGMVCYIWEVARVGIVLSGTKDLYDLFTTDESVALICNITGRIHRHIDMIMPRILELKEVYEKELKTGEMTILDIIRIPGSRLMV